MLVWLTADFLPNHKERRFGQWSHMPAIEILQISQINEKQGSAAKTNKKQKNCEQIHAHNVFKRSRVRINRKYKYLFS